MDYAHRQSIIHRDVKPSNILITADGEPMLTDFGIAKLLEKDDGHTLTGSGVGIGTPEYMAPEQGIGHEVDARVDIYSLGIVLYEMVTGRKPYTADTPMAVVLKQMTDPLPRPTDFNREIPSPVEKVLLKALTKKPRDRYENMNAFIQAMEACLVGKPAGVKSLPHIAPSVHVDDEKTIDQVTTSVTMASGMKTWWILAAAFVVIAVIAGGILGWSRLAASSQKPAPGPALEKASVPSKPEPTQPAATPIIEKTSLPENTRTPNPTSTNIPAGTILFAENFESALAIGIHNIYGDWKVTSEDNTNKVYEIDNQNNSDYPGIDLGSTEWRNFVVEYRVKMLKHTSGAPEVILYFRANYNGSDGYVQAINPHWNNVSLGKHAGYSEWQDVITIGYSFNLGQWYHVRVQAAGSRLKIFVEDKLLLDRIDTQFSSGALTFQVGPGAHVLLDDFTVTALEP